MTISSTTRIAGPFTGNGTASTFPFTFKVFAAADLDVVRLNSSTGVETTLALTTDYTVTLNLDQNSNPGGTVTLVAGVLATGFILTITSGIANLQPTDLTNQGGFYPEVINDALDRATIQIQQMGNDVSRSIKAPISDTTPSMELPAAADRSGKYLAFNGSGNPIVSAGTGNDSALRTDLSNTTVASAGAGLVGFRQNFGTSVGRTVLDKMRDTLNVKDFGATGDGTTDDTSAFQAAITAAIGTAGVDGFPKSLFIPAGTYRITGVLNVDGGVTFVGDGHKGSVDDQGTIITHEGTSDLFVFRGHPTDVALGIGGGIRNLTIYKTTGNGGSAIKLQAMTTTRRPGEMFFENIMIWANGHPTASWFRGFNVDGSAANDKNQGLGIRGVCVLNLRCAGCSGTSNTSFDAISFHWMTALFTEALHLDGVGSQWPADVGVRISGNSDPISMMGCNINGRLAIEPSMLDTGSPAVPNYAQVNVTGRVAYVYVYGRGSWNTGTGSEGAVSANRVCGSFVGTGAFAGNNSPDYFLIALSPDVISSNVTISAAMPAVVTWTGHPLSNGDQVVFQVSGGTLPSPITAGRPYFVRNVAANTFNVANTAASGDPLSTTTASTATVVAYKASDATSYSSRSRVMSNTIATKRIEPIRGTGVSPTIDTNADIVVSGAVFRTDSASTVSQLVAANSAPTGFRYGLFEPHLNSQVACIGTSGIAINGSNVTSPSLVGATTVTFAAAGQNVTWTGHGLPVDARVVFKTTGTLPTELTQGVAYWVVSVVNSNTITISATRNGTAITFTSGAGSGTHTGCHAMVLTATRHRIFSVLSSPDSGLFYSDAGTFISQVSGTSGVFTTTLGTASRICVYKSLPGPLANEYTIANEFTTSKNIDVLWIGSIPTW